ncbi:MAG TPA: thioether cross-link-forming SCIFF peptide maturase [Bacillota bacterium]|nr:thioether cross-link-forming SCIFF peptide maturase [Bacillota bacterium]
MVHQFKLGGYNIVLDVNSGSVHSVDDVAYDMIALYPEYPREEIISQMLDKYRGRPDVTEDELGECYSDIQALVDAKKLYSPDEFEKIAALPKPHVGTIKALCLHVAHTCNLNCGYCFAGQGRYRGEREVMNYETGCAAIDFLIEHSGRRHNLEVDFFGGEPLMCWETVKKIVAYARERERECGKNFRFTLTTNGLLIDDDVIEFCNREMHNVVLSLDGRREVNDRFRKTLTGQGSYDIILPKFKKFVEARGDRSYYIRGTYTHFNTDFTEDILHMADLGFDQLSMEPVVCPPDEPYALTEDDLPVLLEQYEKLAFAMLERRRAGRGFAFYHFILDLEHGPCVYKRITGCGSGTEYLAVTPKGELYPCHQFVGDPKFRLGSLSEGLTNKELQAEFGKCNIYTRPECRECWARFYCAGGCAANAYHATGRIDRIYEYGCRLLKKRIECAIMLKVAEFEEENSHKE